MDYEQLLFGNCIVATTRLTNFRYEYITLWKMKNKWKGWVYPVKNKKEWTSKILKNIPIGKNFYFVHSFVGLSKNPNSTVAICNYSGISIPAVVSIDNIFGCQFHPEKSGDNGLTILKNFCEI